MASSSSSSSNRNQRQRVRSKSMEEIVKHMSNLPSYLERGKPIHDKALNFGVLDWGRLEQWQYYHEHPNGHKQHVIIRANKHSPFGNVSTSGTSSNEKTKIHDEVVNDVENFQDSKIKENVSRKQARFQMAVKNGRPLFTFTTDDKDNDLVAATVRNLTGKDENGVWIYTFFTIQEVKKKKSGWLHHGNKDKEQEYLNLPNVIAQMKVITNCTTREFILSSVDSGQPDREILDVHVENELAAIVVRFPRKEDVVKNEDCFSMTVILPGGHHSVPRKGEPSRLIERWRSGGRCDCDGWDIGCRLRILANNVHSNSRSNRHESFDLFLQGDVMNKRPFLSLSKVKDGMFSVDYNSSLPLLHAFSVCISVIECRKSSRHAELRTYIAKQDDDDVYDSLLPVGRIRLNI